MAFFVTNCQAAFLEYSINEQDYAYVDNSDYKTFERVLCDFCFEFLTHKLINCANLYSIKLLLWLSGMENRTTRQKSIKKRYFLTLKKSDR